MFHRLFATIVLAAAFLGGYYLGRKPQSPDIFAWAQRTYRRAAEVGGRLSASEGAPGGVASSLPRRVMIEGKTYLIDGNRLVER